MNHERSSRPIPVRRVWTRPARADPWGPAGCTVPLAGSGYRRPCRAASRAARPREMPAQALAAEKQAIANSDERPAGLMPSGV
jgi:hypothetical protein